MGQSLVQNYMHFVFSTKNRAPLIYLDVENALHGYINGVCKKLNCPALEVGSHLDHIHILCRVHCSISVSTLVQKIKANSSRWMKSQDNRLKNFAWQDGYGGFSVSNNHLNNLIHYISNQHDHHRSFTFKEEYLRLLKEYNLEYNEDYLW